MAQKSLAERFEALEKDLHKVLSTKHVKYSSFMNSNEEYVEQTLYTTWISRVKKLLEDSFGKESDFYTDFIEAQKGFYSTNYYILSKQLKPVFEAAKEDLKYSNIQPSNNTEDPGSKLKLIINILERFPAFCRQLRNRYNGRDSIEVNDEYDVQDLVHALLTLHFDDIRPEEYTPSYAGASSRQDFLLKKERIVIEVKKTRKSLGAGKIGEELIIDMARYRTHQDCDTLVCFVYDPDGWVSNPKGVIADLEGADAEGKTRVVIAQF
ncbi:TPA: malate dehydrogenase [Raoultella ornithinolytica]